MAALTEAERKTLVRLLAKVQQQSAGMKQMPVASP
jgi:hypothetical protein